MHTSPILIVDDEPHNLAALEHILSPDHVLVFARHGVEALAAIQKHHPCLVLLDIDMPVMNGYDVCRALKANPATDNIPVIFISGKSTVGDETKGFEVGAVDYIVKPVSPAIVRARVRTHLSLVRASHLEKSYFDAIHMLGEAGHYNDNDTGVHIWRMAAYAGALAKACGLATELCQQIELAAPMHDTGKIGVANHILKKAGKLDADEWVEMKKHPRIGHDILSKSDAPLFVLAAEIALRHHERWDGTGYPDGLSGVAIPQSARIVALADVFDALAMRRPYKDSWPVDRVMTTLRDSSGSHFEPRLVHVFDAILPQILQIKAAWDDKEADTTKPA